MNVAVQYFPVLAIFIVGILLFYGLASYLISQSPSVGSDVSNNTSNYVYRAGPTNITPYYLYCIGGIGTENVGMMNSTYYAQILNNGSISPWRASTPYKYSVGESSCIYNNGTVHCIGGYNETSLVTEECWKRASGNWSWNCNTYPKNTTFSSCVWYNSTAYCAVGLIVINNAQRFSNLSYFAKIGMNGNITNWGRSSNYPVITWGTSCASSGSTVYCIGGYRNNTEKAEEVLNNAYYATLTGNGILQWTPTTQYPVNISDPSCFVDSGHVYCVGGMTGTNSSLPASTNLSYYAPITQTGLGQWRATTGYPTSEVGSSCQDISGRVYCIGGGVFGGGGMPPNPFTYSFSANISSDGIGQWKSINNYPVNALYSSCVTTNQA